MITSEEYPMPNSTNRAAPASSSRMTTTWSASPAAVDDATASTVTFDRRVIQLSPAAGNITVAPGSQATVSLTVYNPTSIVENFRLELLGATSSWATLSPAHTESRPIAV